MTDQEIDRHVENMRDVLGMVMKDPVHYGVPRSLFAKSIELIEELRAKLRNREEC